MRYENRALLERLAADYAVGALRGTARRRFERLMAEDATIALLVDGWSARLDTLAEAAPRIEPPAGAWAAIEARIAREAAASLAGERRSFWRFLFAKPTFALPRIGTVGLWYCLGFWRGLGLTAVAATIALLVYVAAAPEFGGARTTHVAVLADSAAKPALVANLDLEDGALRLNPVALPAVESGKSLELWILPPGGGTPRSLGVIAGTEEAIPLAVADVADLAAGALAVSLEPTGGSPTGLPTGPVLYSGAVLPAS